MSLVTLIKKNLSAAISSDGQLVSLSKNDLEYMHGAGKPEEFKQDCDRRGWDRSELIMFPIVGKPRENIVHMDGRPYSMDQHGISRAIPFTIDAKVESAVMRQVHDGESVSNPKYHPGISNPEMLDWPAYLIEKSIKLLSDSVEIELMVQNLTKIRMGYRLGWHPAFRLQGSNDDALFTFTGCQTANAKDINLAEVIEKSKSGAYLLSDVDSVRYHDRETTRGVQLDFEGFSNAMLWTKSSDSGMFCIEPVTHLPDADKDYLDKVEHESLARLEIKRYLVKISLF